MTGLTELGCGPPVDRRDLVEQARERAIRQQALLENVLAEMRLGLFREWLVEGVTHVSSLVPAVLVGGDGDRSAAMRLLRPTASWPHGSAPPRKRCSARPSMRKSTRLAEVFRDVPLGRAYLFPDNYHVDRIGIDVVDRSVELFMEHQGSAFTTRGGRGVLRIRGRLPEAAASACVGRLLDEVVTFPRLSGRGLVVSRIVQRAGHTLVGMEVVALPVAEWPDPIPF